MRTRTIEPGRKNRDYFQYILCWFFLKRRGVAFVYYNNFSYLPFDGNQFSIAIHPVDIDDFPGSVRMPLTGHGQPSAAVIKGMKSGRQKLNRLLTKPDNFFFPFFGYADAPSGNQQQFPLDGNQGSYGWILILRIAQGMTPLRTRFNQRHIFLHPIKESSLFCPRQL